jgi:hypothetical protein
MTFADHCLGLLKNKSVKVELHFMDPISTEVTSATDRIRTELAEKSWKAIQDTSTLKTAPEGFGERRAQMALDRQ